MNGADVISLYQGLDRMKQGAHSWAEQLRKFVIPYSPTELQSKFSWLGLDLKHLHDSTAMRANERLAAATQSFLFDPSKKWFSFKPSAALALDKSASARVSKWLNDCAERMFQAFAESNFYTARHQCLLDRGGLGTGGLYSGISNDNKLMFSYVPFDSFVFAEDEHCQPCVFIRRFEWTADQAAKFFGGVERLSKGMQDAYGDLVERYKKLFKIYHAVGKKEGGYSMDEMGCYSIYVEEGEKHILEEGGFDEFPYMVTRFLRWGDLWGFAPARLCWPEIVDLQFGRRESRLLSELKAFPRIAVSADLVGRVNLRPGGQTVMNNKGVASSLTEWASVGQYSELFREMELNREVIRSSYYLDVLDLFNNANAGMTATEVNARKEEQLRVFSPTFFQELNDSNPMMMRVFGLMYRARMFDMKGVPKELLIALPDGGAMFNPNALPKVVYCSKFIQLLNEVQNAGLLTTAEVTRQMAAFDPTVVYRFDWDFAAQEICRNSSSPESFILDDEGKKRRMEEVMAFAQGVQQMNEGDNNGIVNHGPAGI